MGSPRPPARSADEPGKLPARPASLRLGWVLLWMFLLGVLYPMGALVLAVISGMYDQLPVQWHLVPVAPVTLLTAKVLVDSGARWTGIERIGMVTSLGALLVAVPLGLATERNAWVVMDLNPTRAPGSLSETIAQVSGILLVSFLVLLVRDRTWLTVAPPIRLGAMASCLGLGTLLVLAALRGSTRPDLQSYERSLERFDVDPAGVPGDEPAPPPRLVSTNLPPIQGGPPLHPGLPGERIHKFGKLTAVQSCATTGCVVTLADSAPTVTPAAGSAALAGVKQGWDRSIRLHLDEQSEVVYVDSPAHSVEKVFRRNGGVWHLEDYEVGDVASRTRAPRRWVATGGLALVFALGLLLLRSFSTRPDRRLEKGIHGFLREDGIVMLEDQTAVRLVASSHVPPGPVLLLPGPSGDGAVFRDHAAIAAERVVAGGIEEHRRALALRGLDYDAAILAVVVLGGTPLVVAAHMGLLP